MSDSYHSWCVMKKEKTKVKFNSKCNLKVDFFRKKTNAIYVPIL